MKQRLIDLALLAALVITAAAIAFTLLNLGRGQRPSIASAPEPVETSAQPSNQPDTQSSASIVPIRPEAEPIVDPDSEAAAETPQPDTTPETAAPGSVALEQIGFSYVTGGAGACGIVLEPWQHIAVSRELLEEYGCGAEVHVELPEEIGGHHSFNAVIADTMSPAHTRTVNIYIAQDEPAFEYGLLDSGTLTVGAESQ